MFKSLRARLLISYIVVIVVILFAAGLTLALLFRGGQDQVSEARLKASIPLTTRLVRALTEQGMNPEQIVEELKVNARVPRTRVLLLNRDRVIGDTGDGALVGQSVFTDLPPARLRATLQSPVTGMFGTPSGERFVYALSVAPLPQPRKNRRTPLLVALITPRQSLAGLGEIGQLLLWAAGIALLVGLALAWLISRSVAKPLKQIAAATEQVAQGDLDVDLHVKGPLEVVQLAEQFGRMTNEVKTSRQAQREFIANVSHDLKTPLTSIQGFSQAILEGVADDPERTQRSAQVIHDEALRMSRLVEQLLDLARLDAGQIEWIQAPVDIDALLTRVVERLSPAAELKHIDLHYCGEQGIWLLGDADRLMQVFLNLLDNAIHHTPEGGRVTCLLRRPPGAAGTAEIQIDDTGPGIPHAELPHVFDRFYQADKARSRDNMGLGLAIVQEIILAHGGEVGVESTVGSGARFWVRLPLRGK